MPTWSDNLKIELLDVGASNWGNLTNNNFKWALEESITGYATATFPSDADYDWAAGYTNSNSSQAQRNLVINVVGTLSQTRALIVPTIEKQYIVQNNTTGSQSITVKTSAGTGVTVPNGAKAHLYVDGTNVVSAVNYAPALTLGAALPVASGGTGVTTLGTGVVTALGINTGSAGAFVVDGGALGTPLSGTLTNATGLPISTGVSGLGTNVATALAVNVGSAGAFVVNGGALGTPSSGTLTSCTGLPVSTGISGLGANVAAFLATPSSANLAAAVTNETGSGSLVFATSPTLVTPTLGVATATSINGLVLNRGTGTGNAESVAVGGTALDSSNNSAERNTAIGYAAGTDNTSGKQNVFVGYTSGKDLTTGEKNIYIGFEAQASAGSAAEEIVIGFQLNGKGNKTTFIGSGTDVNGGEGIFNSPNTTTWQTTSDERLKKNIVDNTDGLAKIEAIRVRNFEYRTSEEIAELPANAAINKSGVQLGVIAQEMLPECVSETSLGVLSVNTDPLVWYLVNAVKELSAQVKALQSQLK